MMRERVLPRIARQGGIPVRPDPGMMIKEAWMLGPDDVLMDHLDDTPDEYPKYRGVRGKVIISSERRNSVLDGKPLDYARVKLIHGAYMDLPHNHRVRVRNLHDPNWGPTGTPNEVLKVIANDRPPLPGRQRYARELVFEHLLMPGDRIIGITDPKSMVPVQAIGLRVAAVERDPHAAFDDTIVEFEDSDEVMRVPWSELMIVSRP